MAAIGTATLFLAAVCALALRGTVPLTAAAVYLAASATAVVVYRIDKSAAQRGAWRARERTLHLLSLIGGWPGALVAQRIWHHKSRKASFQLVFWMTVAVNCSALAWWLWMRRQS
ncbi:MAG TPA: DUF1294 domain-containing protein [Vicinamibacterales bacterium]|nr:DUF1294 domain-containing protein [Vicinamibacterales bacterium]